MISKKFYNKMRIFIITIYFIKSREVICMNTLSLKVPKKICKNSILVDNMKISYQKLIKLLELNCKRHFKIKINKLILTKLPSEGISPEVIEAIKLMNPNTLTVNSENQSPNKLKDLLSVNCKNFHSYNGIEFNCKYLNFIF